MTQQVPENEPSIYDQLVGEYVELQAAKEPIDARMNEIKKYLRDLDYGTYDFAGQKVTIGRNARLNEKKFREMYPPETYPNLYKLAVDSAAMKENLPGAVITALQDEGEPRVGVK